MKRILLVDDMLDLIEGERELLEDSGLGYEVVATEHADKVMEMLAIGSFDLIVLDLRMPHTDGLSLLREIRQKFSVPVMIYSAYLHTVPEDLLRKEGANMILTKPAPVDFFLDCVKTLLDPESGTSIILKDGYKIEQIDNKTLMASIQNALQQTESTLQDAAKSLSLSEEYLTHLLRKLHMET